MSSSIVQPLILDLIEWIAARERTYEQVMDAWRTSCPRLTIWEDANELGLIASEQRDGHYVIVPTDAGLALLRTQRSALKNGCC